MTGQHEKRLFNRYDQYQASSIFSESADDYFSKKLKTSWRRFYIKAILGVLLFINGYLSHWGPWTWPKNYYLLAASVVIYHVASYIYSRISGLHNIQGHFVGDFVFGSTVRGLVVRIGEEDKAKYTLVVLKQEKLNEELIYTDYFTVEGYFLEQKFHKKLDAFVEKVKKAA